jgi:tetratricopeptide (TPR) repeat protein
MQRESGAARLKEAVAAYRNALQERTRERVPLDWAATQYNLGNAIRRLGERERGTARLEEAIAAYRNALQELTRERVPLQWAMSFGNHGIAMIQLAQRIKDTAMADAACQQIEAALELTRAAGHAPLASVYELWLPGAYRIRDALRVS